MIKKKEGVKMSASPFMEQEKNVGSVSMVVGGGINSTEELLRSANMLRSATLECELESPSAFNRIESNQISILSIPTLKTKTSPDTPKESLMTSISKAKQSDLKQSESRVTVESPI